MYWRSSATCKLEMCLKIVLSHRTSQAHTNNPGNLHGIKVFSDKANSLMFIQTRIVTEKVRGGRTSERGARGIGSTRGFCSVIAARRDQALKRPRTTAARSSNEHPRTWRNTGGHRGKCSAVDGCCCCCGTGCGRDRGCSRRRFSRSRCCRCRCSTADDASYCV